MNTSLPARSAQAGAEAPVCRSPAAGRQMDADFFLFFLFSICVYLRTQFFRH